MRLLWRAQFFFIKSSMVPPPLILITFQEYSHQFSVFSGPDYTPIYLIIQRRASRRNRPWIGVEKSRVDIHRSSPCSQWTGIDVTLTTYYILDYKVVNHININTI